jgi:hypothetical protein
VAAKNYIAINAASTNTEERDLLADVGEFAYVDQQEITAPFDTHTLGIGSYEFVGSNWTNVTHAPSVLPAGGHFQVFTADNSRIILYTVSVASAVKNSCFLTRSARLVITAGVAESWAYFAQGTTMNFGKIKIASEYDGGMATKMEHEVYGADWINQYAFLDRGSRSAKINFNGLIKPGRYRINNVNGWGSVGSVNYPPTTISTGYLEVSSNGCSVFQKYYPDDANKTGLLFRERTEAGVWNSWFTASEGNMLVGTDKVKVPTYYRRGIASGYALTEVYSAAKVDEKFTYVAGTDISIVGNVISYTGSGGIGSETDPIYTASSWYGTTNNSSNWNTAYSWGNHAGLYPLLSGSYANPSWISSLAWSKITGAPTTFTPSAHTHPYTDITGISGTSPITYSGGAIGWNGTTDNVPEGSNLYWTNARGDARYPQLSGSYSNPSWITSLAWSKITGAPDFSGSYVPLSRSLTVAGTTNNITVSGGAQTLAADRTWTVNLAALHVSPLSGGSATQVPYFTTDIYGRVTGITNTNITFPVTSVNGQTGAVVLTTTNIAEGTNLYWTNARGDARYSALGHTHSWAEITSKPTTISGFGITDAYTKTEDDARFVALAGSYSNPSWITSLAYSKITGVPDFAGTYVPLTRSLTVAGTTNNITVSGGAQTLAADRTWTVNLAALHVSPLSGGSGTQVPYFTVDIYGRVTGITNTSITYPVTSVNGQTGAVSLTTDNITEGTTNLYWTTTRGDARYPQLSGSYSNPSWITSLAWSKISGAPDFAGTYAPLSRNLAVFGTTNNITVTGGIQTLGADRSWTVNLASLHVSPLSGGSATQVPYFTVDIYGRVTGITNTSITFPVTSVNGQTGAVSLSTDNVAEGTTNKYYTDSRVLTFGDGRYSLLGHTHTFASLTSKPTTLSGYGITDAISGSGTINYLPKWSSSTALTNSLFYDNGTNAGVGTTTLTYKFNVNGAMYASGDGSSVGMYVGSGQAIRGLGDMYIDAAAGNMYFRTTAGYAYSMTLAGSIVMMGTVTANGSKTLQVTGGIRATAQQQFSSYTSATSFTGTRTGLLGFDSSGNVLTVADTDFAAAVHNHDSSYYTKTQSDARFTQFGHNHNDLYYTKSEGDSRYSAAGHNHNYDYYTKTELNTSGAGGSVHWNNLTGVPGLSYSGHSHDDRYYTESESDGRYTQYGHIHDDRYYTEGEVNSLLSGKSNTGHGHYYTDISGAPWLTYETDPTEVTGLSASVGSNYMQLYIGKKNGGSVGSGSIDLSSIRDADPYGISGVGLSMDSSTVLRVIIYMRGGGNHQATCNIFSGS